MEMNQQQSQRANSSRPYTHGSFQLKLELFEQFIKDFTYVDEELNPEERRQILQDRLTNGYEPFCDVIRNLFGNDVSTQDLKALFRKIALNPDAKVDWSELFGIGGSEDVAPDLLLNDDTSSVFTTSKRKTVGEAGGDKKRRDIVQSIVHVPKYDFYISASQKGVVCQWSSRFRLQACTDIMESSWVTGCAFLTSLRRIAVSTERAIALWDYRAKQKKSTIYQIKRMENSPQCMIRVPWRTNSLNEDTIMFGDDQGYVNILTISSKDLHMKNSTAKADSQVVAIEPNKLSKEMVRRKFHDDWVLKVKYFPQLEMFGSCSASSNCSFILGSLDRLLDHSPVREISVPKGINSFDYCTKANVIVTAGSDKIIRIWHPLIFTRPTGKLLGHLFTIVEIAVNEKDQQLISLSTARVFRIWDIQTLTCLQVFTDNEVRPGEKRISAMLFDAKHDRLITGCSVIDTWPLTRAIQDSLQVPHTHDRPICQLMYNPHMNQVISACTEGIFKVWEMETSQMVYQVSDAHGHGNEITAMNTDSTGYRLVTGAYDGSIKVWDFGSGQLYKRFPEQSVKTKENSITGLLFHTIDNTRCILASAWGKQITIFEDCYDSPIMTEFKILSDVYFPLAPMQPAQDEFFPFVSRAPLPAIGGQDTQGTRVLSSCEVTCLEYTPPVLIAGTTEGSLVMWNLNTEKVIHRFELPLRRSARSSKRQRRSESERLVHTCRVVVHRVRKPIVYGSREAKRILVLEPGDGETEDMTTEETETEELKNDGKSDDKVEQDDAEMGDELENQERDIEMKGGLDSEEEKDDAVDDGDNNRDGEGQQGTGEQGGDVVNEETGSEFATVSESCLISCHHDGYLRFWSLAGKLLTEVRAVTRRQASAVTAMSTDVDCNYVVSGDSKGYITVWDVGNFLLDPPSESEVINEDKPAEHDGEKRDSKNVIKQVVCWRGHLTRIVGLEHVASADVIVSASTDCSVRVWYRDTGHFIGFFGQPRLWHLPSSKSVPSTPVRPYDISEVPIKTLKNLATKHKAKADTGVDCPLMFDDARWSPFRHSAKPESKSAPSLGNKKFFDSLSKPKHYNSHLHSSRTGSPETGAVYRALPVYTIDEPERLKTPAINRTSSWLTKKGGKSNLPLRTSSPIKEQVVSRFPHLVMGGKR